MKAVAGTSSRKLRRSAAGCCRAAAARLGSCAGTRGQRRARRTSDRATPSRRDGRAVEFATAARSDREGHRRPRRGHARREGEHAPHHRRQPGLQRSGRSELPRRSCRRSRRRFASACSTIRRRRPATGICRWRTPSKAGATPRRRDGTLCCMQPLIAPLNSAKPPAAPTSSPRRAAAARALEVLALLTAVPEPGRRQAGDVVPRGAEGRIRARAEGRSRIAPASRLTPRSSTPSSTATSNSASSRRQGQGRT